MSFITDHAVVGHTITHLRRTRPGLFPPARRGAPIPTSTETSVCRADADGFTYAHDLPPDE